MPPFHKLALSAIGALCLAVPPHAARAQTPASPPPVVAEEFRRARNDFAAGGIRELSNKWFACVDHAQASQDANVAERCIVYGYGALLLGDAGSNATPWMRHLTADIVAPGQNAMLDIMGIPPGPRQSWLNRYRNWISASFTPTGPTPTGQNPDSGASDGGAREFGAGDVGGREFHDPPVSDAGGPPPRTDLARAADGKYPREALRDPEIAEALRQLIGGALFSRLKTYGFGAPMEFNGHFTLGVACEQQARGVSEARFVFSPNEVWVGIIDGGRMRIYGNPPRHARALLLREGTQSAWRGPIDDMNRPAPPTLIPVAADPAPNGLRPRMTIAPHYLPVSVTDPAPPRIQPEPEATEIRLRNYHGNLVVPVMVNNAITVPFTVDSGASDVSVSSDVLQRLIDSGTMNRSDFLGKQVYHLADGSKVTADTFRIHALKVGDREVRDVMGSVTNDADSLLLGQSFLTRFHSWSIDNQRQVLLLK
jgi:clan AA aspartic protease (TIGR02281 family)